MSGHSKWSTIKRKKAAVDAKKAKVWTRLLREVTVSARLGSGDPEANPRLRSAIADARGSNVPNDNIERAIKKGTGELDGGAIEEVTYEGYGPGGVAVLVEAITDNKNRTVSELRHLFSRHGGNLGENGCVAWMFDRRGYFAITKDVLGEDRLMELAVEVGAEDYTSDGELYELYAASEDYARIKEELEGQGVEIEDKALAMIPQTYMSVDPEASGGVMSLMEALEDHDDVQNVWSNVDLDESMVLAESGS